MRLIQICASQNDLFGLDADGAVHHYNFNTNNWIALGRGRPQPGAVLPGLDGRPPAERDVEANGSTRGG
jgi:hypothetical protein